MAETPETLKDLYEVGKKVLSTEELDALVEEAKRKYSFTDIIRAREKISSATRGELEGLVSGLPIPKGKDILTKLDPYLPGGAQVRQAVDAVGDAAVAAVATGLAGASEAAHSIPGAFEQATKEAIVSGTKQIQEIKDNPIKAFTKKVLGWTPEKVLEDFKKLSTEDASAGWMEKLMRPFLLLWVSFKAKMMGVSLDGKPDTRAVKTEETEIVGTKVEAEKFLSAKSYDMTSKLLIYGVSREKFDTALGGAVSAVKDATWGLTDVKKKEATMSTAIVTLGLAKFQEKSWGELKSLGENGILSLLGQSKPEEKAAIKLILEMMGKQEGRFDIVFQGEAWKTLPLKSLLSKLYRKEGYDKIEALTDAIKDFDPSKIANLPGEIFTKVTQSANGEYELSGVLSGQYDSLKSQGISATFIGMILSTEKGNQNLATFLGNMKNEKFSPNETAFLEKILTPARYLDALKVSLVNRFGFTNELMGQLSSDKIFVKDILEIYTITAGNTDVSSLDKGRKALLFTKLQMYFGNKDANALGRYIGQLVKEGAKKYPDAMEIGNMIDSTLNYGTYKATFTAVSGGEKILDTLLGVLGVTVDSRSIKALGAGGALAGIIWLAIKMTPVGRVAALVAMLLSAMGIAGFTAVQASR